MVVRTGRESHVALRVGPNATMLIEHQTRIAIPEIAQDGDKLKTRVSMAFGQADVRVDRIGLTNDFEVATPTATLAVRGTTWRITWDAINACQTNEPSGASSGVTAVAGYFYLTAYTPDRLEITVRAADNKAVVADCNSAESIVAGNGAPFHSKSYLGYVEFSDGGRTPGYNPCGLAHPVIESTWTGVKTSGSGK